MGGDAKARKLGLRLFWLSPVFMRERFSTIWYLTAATRDKAQAEFEKDKIQGKPRYTKIERLER